MKFESYEEYLAYQQPGFDLYKKVCLEAAKEGYTAPNPHEQFNREPTILHWVEVENAQVRREAFNRGYKSAEADAAARDRDRDRANAFLRDTGWDARTATAMFTQLLKEQEAQEEEDANWDE